ncbi:MAG: hypothetical protein ABUL77_02555 [Bacteroidota bacterium]
MSQTTPRTMGTMAVAAVFVALAGATPGATAHATPPPLFRPTGTAAAGTVAPTEAAATPAAPAPAGTSPAPSPSPPGAPPPPPAAAVRPTHAIDAAEALERSRASYEYGDIDEMVESARPVADGRLRPTPAQRASALRYLGIGLFLTGRPEGAETAFFELLRLRPESRLDPRTTRPDVVTFFDQVRTRYAQPITTKPASPRP